MANEIKNENTKVEEVKGGTIPKSNVDRTNTNNDFWSSLDKEVEVIENTKEITVDDWIKIDIKMKVVGFDQEINGLRLITKYKKEDGTRETKSIKLLNNEEENVIYDNTLGEKLIGKSIQFTDIRRWAQVSKDKFGNSETVWTYNALGYKEISNLENNFEINLYADIKIDNIVYKEKSKGQSEMLIIESDIVIDPTKPFKETIFTIKLLDLKKPYNQALKNKRNNAVGQTITIHNIEKTNDGYISKSEITNK